MPMKNPPHPGDFIRTEIIQPAGLSVTAAAAALKVSRPALSSLLNGKASLSGDMGLRIEKAFGVKMDTLMRMQSAYDIARTRLRERHIRVRRIPNTSGTYERAHRQATALLDEGFHLGGVNPGQSGRDERSLKEKRGISAPLHSK
jgi:addiction module HigA family antidote